MDNNWTTYTAAASLASRDETKHKADLFIFHRSLLSKTYFLKDFSFRSKEKEMIFKEEKRRENHAKYLLFLRFKALDFERIEKFLTFRS